MTFAVLFAFFSQRIENVFRVFALFEQFQSAVYLAFEPYGLSEDDKIDALYHQQDADEDYGINEWLKTHNSFTLRCMSGLREDAGGQIVAPLCKSLGESRTKAGRREMANDFTILIQAGSLKFENFLHGDDLTFHTG